MEILCEIMETQEPTYKRWTRPRLLVLLSNFYWFMEDLRSYELTKQETGKQIRLWLDRHLKRETFRKRNG